MNSDEITEALKAEIIFFGLSTCMWCQKTARFLDEKGVIYSKIFVDLLDLQQKREIHSEVKKYNKNLSYPTVKIGETIVIGYDKEKLEKALGL